MSMMKRFFALLLLPLLFVGCSSITNLTPSKYPRNTTGMYHVEAAWKTEQRSIRADSMKPIVMIGQNTYEMTKVPVVRDRWETVIPIPADKNAAHYRFRFDYKVNAFPVGHEDSSMSPEYKLEVTEPKQKRRD